MKKIGLNGYVNKCSVDWNTVDFSDTNDNKKLKYRIMLGFIKKYIYIIIMFWWITGLWPSKIFIFK